MSSLDQAQQDIKALRRQLRVNAAYQRLFETDDGKLVLLDLLAAGNLLQTSVIVDAPHMTSFNDGKRALALHIIERLRWSEGELVALAMRRTAAQISDAEASIGET